ncbi:MAG: SusC/RagA family TonB-linked outer membrane protein, partial [Phocaeicola sp.]
MNNMKNIFIMISLLMSCVTINAQGLTIKGNVKSATDGEALIGVNVSIKGEAIGTITDIDGNYTLQASSNSTLLFSYIGYDAQEIAVSGRTTVNALLTESSMMLEEVVAMGYRTERKADLTGAVSVVKVDDMMKAAENNPMKALQGRIAGMTVTSDGSPSGSATIRIRGLGTLNNNDPLYIIDGVPSMAGMHELNGNDIESIQVLRDASAASIYGSRAANGVIVVTTKKGKKGSTKVNFDAFLTVSEYTNKLEVLNSKQYAEAMWKASINSGENPNLNNIGIRYEYAPDANGNQVLNNVLFPEYLDANKTMKPANTDWFDEITRTGVAQSYNLSVSNGTERGNYFFSLGYYDNDGLVKETNFNRISARINSDFKVLNDIITIGENFTLNRTSEVQQPYQIMESALIAVPFIPVRTEDGSNWGGPISALPDRQNPAYTIDANKNNRY